MKILSIVKSKEPKMTVDIEVGHAHNNKTPSHTYCIVSNTGKKLVTHNTVSLLAGVSPGVHFPIAKYYIRRVRLSINSNLVEPLKLAGYKVEPCFGSEKSTVVVEFPIGLPDNVKTASEVSAWEKLEIAAFVQENWADNQVSVTIDFDKARESKQIQSMLELYSTRLKSVSFLPRFESSTPYPQMPYENITKEQYEVAVANLKPLKFNKKELSDIEVDKFCDGETCMNVPKKQKLDN